MSLTFRFHFDPVTADAWWAKRGWYFLTSGWFWIEADGHELFRYSRAAQEHWAAETGGPPAALPYDEYPVARPWEDLLDLLPAVLDPLPDDLAARVADAEAWASWLAAADRWRASQDDEAAHDAYDTALRWWGGARSWYAAHLTHPPGLWLWRVGDAVHIRWDNRRLTVAGHPAWEATAGEAVVPLPVFLDAVTAFDDALLAAMSARIDAVNALRLSDRAPLDAEQRERATWLPNALWPWVWDTRREYLWDEVRAALAYLDRALGRALTRPGPAAIQRHEP